MDPGHALFEHSRRGHLQEVREELATGVKPDEYFAYDGSTALLAAARGGYGDVVAELLTARADLEVRTDDGSCALLHSVSGGNVVAVAAVLSAGGRLDSVNEDQVTPVLLAAHYGHLEVLRQLLDARADPDYRAPGWGTALDAASGACAELLQARGASRGGPEAAAAAKAGEHFTYGCFDSDGAELAVKSYAGPAAQLPTAGGSGAVPEGPPSSVAARRIAQLARAIGAGFFDTAAAVRKLCDGGAVGTRGLAGVVPQVVIEPPANHATGTATARFLRRRAIGLPPRSLGRTGLQVSPVGFGCHRLEDTAEHHDALTVAIKCGCNFIDVAPNYTDGAAERAVGHVLRNLIAAGDVRRDELVISTKVGNIVGSSLNLESAKTLPGVARVRDDVWHCLEPAWIAGELSRSLDRLGLECVDVLLLHCPEFATKAEGVDMEEVYRRIQGAFLHLEEEVRRGRIMRYGVTAAFYPLRTADPEHLLLERLLTLPPPEHHFQVLQFPLNFAEPQPLWVAHTARRGDGSALDATQGLEAPSLVELARKHGLAILTNRPLDGLYREMRGVLRFVSDVPINGEMQGEDVDALESKLTLACAPSLGDPAESVTEELAAKTIKVLASLDQVDCVLVGMRQAHYVAGIVRLMQLPPLDPKVALNAVKSAHNTISMWFCTATHEADHGTAKDWRLPVRESLVVGG